MKQKCAFCGWKVNTNDPNTVSRKDLGIIRWYCDSQCRADHLERREIEKLQLNGKSPFGGGT